MLKPIFLISFLFITSLALSQIPSNYYNSANGLTGYELKTELKNIVSNGHISRTYDQLYDGNGISGSNGYIDTHSDVFVSGANTYENDGSILDFYSENPTGSDPYNYTHGNNQCGNQNAEGDCYNREHLVPQSSFGSAFPMQSDIHHVIPTDGRVNNFRGSLAFGIVDVPDFTSLNGSKRGSSAISGYNGVVFEPLDEFKGDIARALLYFAVRYEDTVDGYTSFEMFNGSNDQVFTTWAIELLLDWHNNVDPVDERERERNNAAYNFQNNANPFVDHPEYANLIWDPEADTEAPTAPTNLMASSPTISSIALSWTASTDNIAVETYDVYVDDVYNSSTSNTQIVVSGLAINTNFCFTVFAKDEALNMSASSNEVCESTLTGSETSDEIFISEYVEGSSNNKAIEIANFTGATVSLSNYTIARDVNSNGSWGEALQLSGSITNADVHVVTRGNADSNLTALADQLSSGDAMSFNGDDPIGLFKNGVLIDIFGNFSGDNSFENATYRRKESVTNPTTTFDVNAEWDQYAQNTFDDLGFHNQSLSITETDKSDLKLFPNPLNGSNQVYINSLEMLSFKVFNLLGQQQISGKTGNGVINLPKLKPGVYLVQLSVGSRKMMKRLIVSN